MHNAAMGMAATLPYRNPGLKRAHRDPSDKKFTVCLPADVDRALRRRAVDDGTTITQVIIAALDAAGVTERARKGGK